jgi:hypothetical protein
MSVDLKGKSPLLWAFLVSTVDLQPGRQAATLRDQYF